MRLGNTQQYQSALAALTRLKQQAGATEDLKAIALYLFYSHDAEVPTPQFPFVGVDDPRDHAIVQAFTDQWQALIRGDDED